MAFLVRLRRAQIAQLQVVGLIQFENFWLQIAVNYFVLVAVGNRIEDLVHNLGRLLLAEIRLGSNNIKELAASHQL